MLERAHSMQLLQFQISAPEIFTEKKEGQLRAILQSGFLGRSSSLEIQRERLDVSFHRREGLKQYWRNNNSFSGTSQLAETTRMRNPTPSSLSLQPLGEVVCVPCFILRGTLLGALYSTSLAAGELPSWGVEIVSSYILTEYFQWDCGENDGRKAHWTSRMQLYIVNGTVRLLKKMWYPRSSLNLKEICKRVVWVPNNSSTCDARLLNSIA